MQSEDYEKYMRGLRDLMNMDPSVVFRYDGHCVWLRNVHVTGETEDWILVPVGYGTNFGEALESYFNKITHDDAWVIINAFEHNGPRIMVRYVKSLEMWKRKETT